MNAQWSRIATGKLIACLKSKRELWDVNDPAYLVRERRELALSEIVHRVQYLFPDTNLTVKDIRNKIQSIRSQYRKEVRAIEFNDDESLDRGGKSKRPTLWFYDQVSFLRPYIELKRVKKKSSTLFEDNIKEEYAPSCSSPDEMETVDADNCLSPTVEMCANDMESDSKRRRSHIEEDQRELNREKRHQRRVEMANSFLEIFEEMDEVGSDEDTDDFDSHSISHHFRRRRNRFKKRKIEDSVERRHREKMDAVNRFLDLFQQMVDKM